jgi:hypothetical protein
MPNHADEPRARVRPHPDVVARRIGDDTVLVHLRRNQIYALNRTGARFWELIDEGSSWQETMERMLEEFDVTPTELEAEANALLDRLIREELVVREGVDAPSGG